jgi:alpha-glucosidase (family GH31 glycosyl hydrolase)
MWGDDLLVAPVTREGATHWPIYLPKGRWHDFWTHQAHEGPCSITVEAPLDRLPLFVRAGAVVPMGPALQHLSGPPMSDMTLLTYPTVSGFNGSCTFYDDDGTTNGYQQGDYALTEFECSATQDQLVCRIGASGGVVISEDRIHTFAIFAPAAPVHVAFEDGSVLLQGRDSPAPAWWHDGNQFLFVRLGNGPAAVHVSW